MFEFLALMFGGAVSDTMKRNTAIDRAKAEGRPYYYHNGKTYSVATGERLESIGRSLRGAYSHEMVYDAVAEDLKRANESLKKHGFKFHYEINFKSKVHEKMGYVRIENETNKPYVVKSFIRRPVKGWEYELCYVDESGEPTGECKALADVVERLSY